MIIKKGNIYQVLNGYKECAEIPGECGFFYGIHDFTSVNYGENKDINLAFCNLFKIPTFKLPRRGGTMVFAAGDLSFISIDKRLGINSAFVDFLMKKLQEKGIDVVNRNNDLIINDKYKILGCTKRRLEDGRNGSCCHIAINNSAVLVKQICLKPRKNEPAGLGDWGISVEQVEQGLNEFLQIYYKGEINE